MALWRPKPKPPSSPFYELPKRAYDAVMALIIQVASSITLGKGGLLSIPDAPGYLSYILTTLTEYLQYGLKTPQALAYIPKVGLYMTIVWVAVRYIFGNKRGEQIFRNLKKPKTKPVRDKNGILLIGDGDFPFPALLYTQMKSGAPLEERTIDEQLQAAKNKGYDMDGLMFKFLYVPVAMREERFSERREKDYREMLEKMRYKNPSKQGVIMRRVSEYDIRARPDIVREAASFPGTHSDKKWMERYFQMRKLHKLKA